jgi:hypothetical protein
MLIKLLQASRILTRAGCLHIKPPHPRRARHFLKKPPQKFNHGDSISLTMIVPPSNERQVVECQTTEDLIQFIKSYNGTLATRSENGSAKLIPYSKYSELSPSIVYDIISPFFASIEEQHQPWQTSDRAFEDKSHKALIRYVEEQQFSFRELTRVFKVGDEPKIEWEGVFELANGEVWFLECKHCVSMVFYHIILHITVI